jgi:pimeloyl-ACP methyl ester carboxylesterase
MTGAASPSRPDVYADTSPAELLPLGVPQVIVNGDGDGVAPPAMGEAYTARARVAGDHVEHIVPANSGHVEEIAPGTLAFEVELTAMRRLLGLPAAH